MPVARLRLACLWLSQVARLLADCALATFVAIRVAPQTSWQSVGFFFLLPFFLLAHLNGALCNGLPKRAVLAGSCGFSIAAIALILAFPDEPTACCLGLSLAMIGGAVYRAARGALLPAASADSVIPLPRINGWMGMGSAAAVGAGILLVAAWQPPATGTIATVILGFYLLALVAGLAVDFPSDVRRPEPANLALRGFYRDCLPVLGNPESAACLIGFAVLLAVFLGSIATRIDPMVNGTGLVPAVLWISAGTALGSVVGSLQGHPRRTLGLVPLGLLGFLAALIWFVLAADLDGPGFFLGFAAGLVLVPFRATYQAAARADGRGNAMAAFYSIASLGLLAGLLVPTGQTWLFVALAAVGCFWSWWRFFREGFEQLLEIAFWPVYRIHGHGPGLDRVPPGPLLIVSNHTAWFDPLWVAKVVRREIFPMMTSDFYDLPGVHFFFAHVFHAVRVQASAFRREAPELKDATAVLDRGACLSIFPEGWLRRSPEPTVRQFGQGVWHILRERPETPVILCWIEGGWGSYTSYFKGKPTVNKRFDFWRRIDVAVSPPIVIPPELLPDQRATRTFLMRKCLEARGYLGLEVPKLPAMGDEEETPSGKPE